MLDSDFASIRSSEDKGPVYDRGGVNVTINVDGKETRIDNSGNHFIEEKWQRNFALICGAIKAYAEENKYRS